MALQICVLNLNREQKELRPHGTLDFPCAGYEEEYSVCKKTIPPAATGNFPMPGIGTKVKRIPWHWHEELEAIYIVAGNLNVQVPGRTYKLAEGDLLVINSGVLHSADTTSWCRLQSLVFHPLLVTGNPDSVYARKYLQPLVGCRDFRAGLFTGDGAQALISKFLIAFRALAEDAPGYEFTVREHVAALCFALYQHFVGDMESSGGKDDRRADHDELRIRRMMEFIHEHYAEELSLADIAKTADIGERECLRCFRKMIRNSPMQYLLRYRTQMGAEKLLEHPAENISNIAMSCGFDSPSNFSKMFKRFYDCTPREYRKAMH